MKKEFLCPTCATRHLIDLWKDSLEYRCQSCRTSFRIETHYVIKRVDK